MSTTATVSPYDAEEQRRLAEAEARCDAAADRTGDDRRRARAGVHRVALTVRSVEHLVRAAEAVGYRAEGRTARAAASAPGRLVLARGREQLVIERTAGGRLVVAGTSRTATEQVVREHVVLRAVDHLRARGMEVSTRRSADGRVELEGRGRASRPREEPTAVSAAVDNVGRLRLDVRGAIGDRCGVLATDLARAVEGECVDMSRKPEFFHVRTTGENRLHA